MRYFILVLEIVNALGLSKKDKFLNKEWRHCSSKRPVLKISLEGKMIKEYESISKASKENNISKGNINNVCKGKRKTAGGYKWKYK